MTEKRKKLGFIGGGQMGEALIKGVLAAGLYRSAELVVAEPSEPRRQLLADRYDVPVCQQSGPLWAGCDVLVLAVKPQVMGTVLAQAGPLAGERRQLLISIAAGVSTAFIEEALAPRSVPVVRVMPNTPALVLAGASALCPGRAAGEEDLKLAEGIFAAVGKTVILPETAMDAVTGLSGSGPAYVFTFLESLIDAGVKVGLSREVAAVLARQTIAGSLQLVEESRQSPAELRAMVTSPGGTTIAGLHALERGAFRALIMDAVEAATRRSRELGSN
ncbi:pyrroline-5-carboxylate reductase [Desulfurivibrio alkaliphilus]|uniref:Pyrroline-5-carboxylate reductase n=1 Tax=Desulfurivibrio alkaliphilus (strain DSM 19089 / UNIQEM U267 / AHT2) TaxID=589865 RepID=D6Z2J7_DESAT|nr:pyrroline-5-carboxylate reductase [Desulfurivibrio alkaliphilus]ADH85772.1 pyrroline-5-carboxylate reductase [Desulfurivibrio alkaliphilus AHT 2]